MIEVSDLIDWIVSSAIEIGVVGGFLLLAICVVLCTRKRAVR